MMDFSNINYQSHSDLALLEHIGKYIRHQRLLQNKTQQKTADDAGINRSTLSLLENGEAVSLVTLLQVLRSLDLLDIMKIFEIKEEPSPLELAKRDHAQPKRARTKGKNPDTYKTNW